MKNLFLLLASLVAISAHADEKIMSVRTVVLPVDVSTAGVRWTNSGYGDSYYVKILVPEIAAETLMNHRNEDEKAPCLATTDIDSVDKLIANNPGVDQVPFEIKLTKDTTMMQDGTCAVSLIEDLSATVRGFHFFHSRTSNLPNRVGEDCQ